MDDGLQKKITESYVVDALSFILDTGSIQFRIECELLDACKEFLLEIIGWNFIVSIQELKEILEHSKRRL